MSHRPLDSSHPDYATLAPLVETILAQAGGFDSFAENVPPLLRKAIDEVIDAPRTDRFTIDQAEKTEKTYLGTKIEIFIRRFLKLSKGKTLDLLVNGVEVDIKNTTARDWMVPRESVGRPAMVIRTNEKKALCDVGLVVFHKHYLGLSENQDKKGRLTAANRVHIWWILNEFPYPPNFWEVLPKKQREEIVNAGSPNSMVAKLFEVMQRIPISRTQIEVVAKQHDYMRRLRKGGGARDILTTKGIAVLSGIYDKKLINALGLGPATSEEFISVTPKDAAETALLRAAGHID
ncbi:NaeI family type II restriction endonuclease [Agrobacterium salinitolerans]|uniref:NaeI family type II restriction endonuclease n=1 Tax=Agrobacterium salinitolerans TaxID=1183413 RepID=UPI0022B8B87C|nr:NaeI family type II restriction endonuclease [Agrobacterium salinitolerans]MCZ7853714.1 NaeI family type II restriction endonuclease [Agrobacterium salinitolerans]